MVHGATCHELAGAELVALTWPAQPQRVFRHGTSRGADGHHLGVGHLAASDIFQITSFAGYESDVALPIVRGPPRYSRVWTVV